MPKKSKTKQAAVYENPVELLQNLIRFNTTNPPGNEEKCIKYLNNLLTDAGFKTKLITKTPKRPNLITCLSGKGKASPLLLYGHVDVVPTENQKWKYPPFEGKIADGYLWGRGALDMKSGVAMMVAALLRAKAENLTPPGDVILAIVSDEESGGSCGAKYLVENHPDLFKNVRYAIGEFGGFTFYIEKKKFYPMMVSEKQICYIKATVGGPSGHGSIPMRGGASAKLAMLLQNLDKYSLPVHISEAVKMQLKTLTSTLPFPTKLFIRLLTIPILTNKILKIMGSKGDVFDPLLHNTVNVVNVHGGEQIWGIPGNIEVGLATTLLPGYGSEDILDELKDIIGSEVELEVLNFEPVPSKPDMGLFDILKDILHKADPEGIPLPILLATPTDARHFLKLGIQTYGFLPMLLPKELDVNKLFHNADERIPVEAVKFGTDNIYKLLQRFI